MTITSTYFGLLWVLLPAVLVALIVRLDAKNLKPYFAVATVDWVGLVLSAKETESQGLWQVVIRRLLYPLIAGFILAWLGVDEWGIGLVGLISCALILWPAIFHGLPEETRYKDWQVVILWAAYLVASAAASVVGWFAWHVLLNAADGDLPGFLVSTFSGWVALALFFGVPLVVFRLPLQTLLTIVRNRREGADHIMKQNDNGAK
jgi:hypothetical protein